MDLTNGIITAGALRTLIKNLKDEDPILIMVENFESGVGGNAFKIDFESALEGEEKVQAIEEDDIWESTLWITA